MSETSFRREHSCAFSTCACVKDSLNGNTLVQLATSACLKLHKESHARAQPCNQGRRTQVQSNQIRKALKIKPTSRSIHSKCAQHLYPAPGWRHLASAPISPTAFAEEFARDCGQRSQCILCTLCTPCTQCTLCTLFKMIKTKRTNGPWSDV